MWYKVMKERNALHTTQRSNTLFPRKTKNFLPDYPLPTPQVFTRSRSLPTLPPKHTAHNWPHYKLLGTEFLLVTAICKLQQCQLPPQSVIINGNYLHTPSHLVTPNVCLAITFNLSGVNHNAVIMQRIVGLYKRKKKLKISHLKSQYILHMSAAKTKWSHNFIAYILV